MDEELYDEFGNYIGPELEDSGSEGDEGEGADGFGFGEDGGMDFEQDGDRMMAVHEEQSSSSSSSSRMASGEGRIVLHEDKKYYPNADEVYPGVRTVLLDEDAQDIAEPIIKSVKAKSFSVLEKEPPVLTYSSEFLVSLMRSPTLIRNVCVLGQLHHGKTMLIDTLVQATQEKAWDPSRHTRYTDTTKVEQEREMSIKSALASLVLESLSGKSYLVNLLDCPGHVNFSDESTAALRTADGAVIVVDAVEGVMLGTERHLKAALTARVSICLVINKVDRLILELKLPPMDAYFKLLHTIEEVNTILRNNVSLMSVGNSSSSSSGGGLQAPRVSPELGNVCFASGQHGWSFSLESFAKMYCERHASSSSSSSSSGGMTMGGGMGGGGMDPQALAKRLWGDWYHDADSCTITRKKPSSDGGGGGGSVQRTFVHYILDPLYKIYSHVLGDTPEELSGLLREIGVTMKKQELHLDPRPLLKLALSRFFGYPRGLVEMFVRHVPSPVEGAADKVALSYTGYQSSEIATSMRRCVSDGPLVIHVTKLYSVPDGSKFLSLARIYSGSVRPGQRVKVLGEGYSAEDDEDMAVAEVEGISVGVGRFSMDMTTAIGAGNLVLLEGVDASIKKTATIVDVSQEEPAVFRSLKFETSSVVKIAVEPLRPSELPKMVEALRRISKSYPLAMTKVEESGEHVVLGTGELYMDCLLHDLRNLYSDIEIKVADPVVSFSETVTESSCMRCFSETPNKKNRFTLLAEPLDTGLAQDIASGAISLTWDKKTVGEFFKSKYDWDLLAARSVWAFGPESNGPNILLDDTLPSEVDRSLLSTVKESISQGFRWGCREGPLCDEPIRNVKFKLLDATLALEPIHRGGGQVIPTARRTVYSSFLLATPRLMEPMYAVEIQAPADVVQAIYPVLARRRGKIISDAPKAGAPFYVIRALIPCMDSFGFETDLRAYTQGQAFCQQVFDHWAVVPGDPLNPAVVLHPLEPSPNFALAKDFMTKTRRRKGLGDDVSVSKYFDDPLLLKLAQQQMQA